MERRRWTEEEDRDSNSIVHATPRISSPRCTTFPWNEPDYWLNPDRRITYSVKNSPSAREEEPRELFYGRCVRRARWRSPLFLYSRSHIFPSLSLLLPLLLLDRRCIRIWVCSVKILARMYVRDALVHSTFTVCARACVWASWVKVKPVLGVAEVGRIRVTDQRSRVSRRTRGEEALGPIESAYREQNGVPACLPAWLPACLAWIYSDPFSPSLSLSLPFHLFFFLSSQSRDILLWTICCFSSFLFSLFFSVLLILGRALSSFFSVASLYQRLFPCYIVGLWNFLS